MIRSGVGIRRLFSSFQPPSSSERKPPSSSKDDRDLLRDGDGHLKEGMLDLALRSYQRAAGTGGGGPAEKRAAMIYEMMGRYMEAIASLDRAVAIDPTDTTAWMGRGFVFWRLEMWPEALASFERAIATSPKDGYPRYCRAVTAEEMAKKRRRCRWRG
ncbi:tetratricopeptide repeat protein [Methanotrichaceae archaeon M04Ac]|jgi:tetratricopeptide (TPR) repeat protein|uniref:Tetratricopeptide repeat protein n=1 Tax=Candidatus Methanocrinis alkalitolerans TaxID=3033395 RepID=A0ABT5XCP2_9EURY|nr:tetratricopeptide repeat protein [Candidatus Methanocrinis alkalitolerans]MDF0592423.1 tetratricopeptide repeat protein [Candidatus Methanocrinis alkalitolerans]